MKLSRSLFVPIMALLALGVGSIWSQAVAQDLRSQIEASSALTEIKKRGTLRAGVSSFVPWVTRNKKGELVGFEIDVIKRLAEDAGWKPEFVPTSFDGIIPALLAGKFDAIMTSIAIRPKRALVVNFTIPYEYYGSGVAASKKLAGGWTSYEDFDKEGVTFVLRRGSFQIDAVKRTWPKSELRFFDDDVQAFLEVIEGRAHAVITAEPKPTFFTEQNPDTLFKPFEGFDPLPPNAAGFAIRKGDPDFLTFLNTWIRLNWKSGFLQERFDYWFTTTGWFADMENNPYILKK